MIRKDFLRIIWNAKNYNYYLTNCYLNDQIQLISFNSIKYFYNKRKTKTCGEAEKENFLFNLSQIL